MMKEVSQLSSLIDEYRDGEWRHLVEPMRRLMAGQASRENRLNILRRRLGIQTYDRLEERAYSRVFGHDSWYQLQLEYGEFLGRSIKNLPLNSKYYEKQFPFRILLINYHHHLVEEVFSPPLHRLIDLYFVNNGIKNLPEHIFAPLYQIDDLAILEPVLDLTDSRTQRAFSYIHPSIRYLELYADTHVKFLTDTLLASLSTLSVITTMPEIHRSFVAYCKLAHPHLNLYIEPPVPFRNSYENY